MALSTGKWWGGGGNKPRVACEKVRAFLDDVRDISISLFSSELDSFFVLFTIGNSHKAEMGGGIYKTIS